MIYVVVGKLCSGKSVFIKHCADVYGFQVISFPEHHIHYARLHSPSDLDQIAQQWNHKKISPQEFFNQYLLPNIGRKVILKDVRDLEIVKYLQEFTYVKVVYIDSTVMQRFRLYQDKHHPECALERFIQLDDYINYSLHQNVIYECADIKLINSSDVTQFKMAIDRQCSFLAKNKFRPSWDDYFMKIAFICKIRSNCIQMNQGAVLTQNNRILATGYMGTPGRIANCYEGGCKGCLDTKQDRQKKDCYCVHPIENILLEAGIKQAMGSTVYATQFPCIWCTKLLVGAGVNRLVYLNDASELDEESQAHPTQGKSQQEIMAVLDQTNMAVDKYIDTDRLYLS